MNIEQRQAAFEAWAQRIGFAVTGKFAETSQVICSKEAFLAGYQVAFESPEGSLKTHTLVPNDELQALRKYKARLHFVADDTCSFNTWVQEDCSVKYRLEWNHGTEWQNQWYDSPDEAIDAAIGETEMKKLFSDLKKR